MQISLKTAYTQTSSESVAKYIEELTGLLRSVGAPDTRIAELLNLQNSYDGDIDVFSAEDQEKAEHVVAWFPSRFSKIADSPRDAHYLKEDNYDWDAWLDFAEARMESAHIAAEIAGAQGDRVTLSYSSVANADGVRSDAFHFLEGGASVDRVAMVFELANRFESKTALSPDEVDTVRAFIRSKDKYVRNQNTPYEVRYSESNFDWDRFLSNLESGFNAVQFVQQMTIA